MAEVDKLNTDREIAGAVPTEGKASSTFSVKSKHGGGLRLEVRKCGARRFRYRFRLAGKQCDMDFGYYPATSLKAAREKHEQAVTLVKQGIDPRSVLEAAKVKNLAMPTLRELFDEWLPTKTAANAKPKPISPRTAKDYREAFELHLAPALGKVRVCDLTRSVLFRHLEQIEAKNGTRLALGLLGQVLDRAVDLEYIDANPARSIKPARVGGSAGKPRERWLETDELRLLWQALERATKGPLGGTTTRSTSFVVRLPAPDSFYWCSPHRSSRNAV
ncbi:integrase arm-type DNA-binding domain-containing protein [Aeromonas intestinalis]